MRRGGDIAAGSWRRRHGTAKRCPQRHFRRNCGTGLAGRVCSVHWASQVAHQFFGAPACSPACKAACMSLGRLATPLVTPGPPLDQWMLNSRLSTRPGKA